MRSRYNTEGSIDYEADREIELLRHVDAELERLRRVDAETGGADGCIGEESLFKPTVKLLRKAGHLGAPVGDIARMTQMTQMELFPVLGGLPMPLSIPQAIQPPNGIPNFLRSKSKA